MKKIAIVLWLLVLGLIIFTAYNFGIVKGRDFMIECWQENNITYDPNYTYEPNDWVYEEPENPILSIDFDTLRLQPGSSICYIEIGDPSVEVSYFEPNMPTDCAVMFDVNAPSGFIIKDCSF